MKPDAKLIKRNILKDLIRKFFLKNTLCRTCSGYGYKLKGLPVEDFRLSELGLSRFKEMIYMKEKEFTIRPIVKEILDRESGAKVVCPKCDGFGFVSKHELQYRKPVFTGDDEKYIADALKRASKYNELMYEKTNNEEYLKRNRRYKQIGKKIL